MAVVATTLLGIPACSGSSDSGGGRADPAAETPASNAPPSGGSAPDVPTDASWLFALMGDSATVDADGAAYRVSLTNPQDVVAFTDRPERLARRLAVDALVGAWPTLFTDVPPNGLLAGRAPNGELVDVVVEIEDVGLDETATLRFSARPVGDDTAAVFPAGLTDVSLFIDDVICPCLVDTSPFVPFDSSF